eukprot:gene5975-8230_t
MEELNNNKTENLIRDRDNKSLPPIRFYDYDYFKLLGEMPRCPENKDMLITYESIDRNGSLFIFFSHCWVRGYPGAPGYDMRPHPDSANHDKYKLMVESINRILSTLTTMTKCYVWLDFGCIDQDAFACLELKMLDKIIGVCDLILTNVHDSDLNWTLPTSYINIFDEYKSPEWNGNDYAYLNRAWCRMDMMYAANIPLENDDPHRISKFKAGLLSSIQNGRRPHLLYGTRESQFNSPPIQLPPMQNSWFDNYSPVKGKLTKESDRVHIQQLIDEIKPIMKRVKVGYKGEYKDGEQYGKGVYTFANGDVYNGDWINNQKHGKGVCEYSDGDKYDGDWIDNLKHGKGLFIYASGEVYNGDWVDDKKHGKGAFTYSSGTVYNGDWIDGKMNGKGVFLFANGDVYDGECKDGKRYGKGIHKYANGEVYNGDWINGKKHGKGEYTFADGAVYIGDWMDDKRHGIDVYAYSSTSLLTPPHIPKNGESMDEKKKGVVFGSIGLDLSF